MPRGKKAQRAGRGTRRPFRATETGPKPSSTNKSGNENTALPEKLPQIPNNLALTLVDAARETGKHDHKAWGALALRTHPVLFVSAGSVEPLKPLEDMLCEATLEESKSPAVPAPGKPSTSPPAEEHGWPLNLGRSSSHEQQPKPHHHSPDASYCHFFYDTGKTHAVNAGVFPRDQNETSELVAEESDSSAEIIIYQGRTKPRDRATGPKLPGKSNNAKLLNDSSLVSNATENKSTKTAKQMPPQDAHMATPELSIVSKRTRRKGKRVANPLRDSEEAKLADYIDNIREHGESYDMLELHHHHQTDLGGEDISLSSDVSDASELSSSSGEDGPVFGHFGNQKLGTKYGDGNDKETMAESPTEVSEGQLDDQTLARLLQDNVLVDGPDSATKNAQYDSDCLRHTTAWCADQPGADFDVMDWERPSIRRRKKGKGAKGRLQLDISDSELEQTLQTAWHNDRFKKAERKRQREEMRALGMLGTKTSPDDMRAKYPNGISVDEIGEELRQFLVNRSALLTLPPMDKHARKMIHELASKFNVKSKSTGNGHSRRPALHRTKGTLQYSESSFQLALSRVTRKYVPRPDARRRDGAGRSLGQGRVNMAAATVRDGEIVGAAAPELGIENRGRAMLEKMGWSSGTALGALDNKGILQPVSQAMKRTKAGLG